MEVVEGDELPIGWSGKLHALEQARRRARCAQVLLLDADIHLAPGVIGALRRQWQRQGGGLVSVMATLPVRNTWERLLLPPFVYFFKLIYPFSLVGNPGSRVAGAAGGCVLLDARVLDRIGGFATLRDALIDDCALAAAFKRAGAPLWLGVVACALLARRRRR